MEYNQWLREVCTQLQKLQAKKLYEKTKGAVIIIDGITVFKME